MLFLCLVLMEKDLNMVAFYNTVGILEYSFHDVFNVVCIITLEGLWRLIRVNTCID